MNLPNTLRITINVWPANLYSVCLTSVMSIEPLEVNRLNEELLKVILRVKEILKLNHSNVEDVFEGFFLCLFLVCARLSALSCLLL